MQPEQEIEHLSATDAAATTQEVRRSILSARSSWEQGMLENMEDTGGGGVAHSIVIREKRTLEDCGV